ncbi:hypothetical protein BDF20DRAFT_899160 [Mycotypha africana]|uniref:uncharacterized protein n=1 Tax=Mycotypha africana TaxID=64632 RepID=UPI0023005126|nr:uncharacterized protein BDF20DRAFT_899160 [Mycotypha africana]KAI8967771.1 hypothetical protein BDF20DRAFT_899160 [Mycotypha africana]
MRLITVFYFSIGLLSTVVYGSTFVTISNETFEDRSAAFGPKISQNGRLGYLIEPEQDPTGCSVVDPPSLRQPNNSDDPQPQKDWIALVRRGGCSFITKVRYMQKSGAIAVIVGDPKNAGWVTMYAPGDTSDITIPSVFISRNEYIRLLNLSKLLKTTPVMAVLQYEEVMTWPFVDIFIIIFISPCIMMAIFCISWKIKQKIQQRRELAPLSVVSKLDVRIIDEKFLAKYHQHENEDTRPSSAQELSTNDSCCAICLEEYALGDAIRILPCHHQFHTCCVDAWLTTRKKLCPICKRDITASNHHEVTPLLNIV